MDGFLKEYLTTQSPSGDEMRGQQVWVKGMYDADKTFGFDADNFGNVLAIKENFSNSGSEDRIRILVASHVDEISYRVSHIEDNGLLRVVRNGGCDPSVSLGSRCEIKTRFNGNHKGVFGQRAVHLRDSWTDEKDVNELYIDVGAEDKKEVDEMGIIVGDIVCGYDEPIMLSENRLSSRALDNKIGGYILKELANTLSDKRFNNIDLYFANCIQEETGLRGSQMIAHDIIPHIVLVTDVCHATDTPNIEKSKVGDIKLGKGGALCRGSLLNEKLVALASKSGESIQVLATKEGTGTDADSFAIANGGTPTCLVKTPLRYMHTQVETCDLRDAKSIVGIFKYMIEQIEDNSDYWKGVCNGVPNKNLIQLAINDKI